MPRFRTLTVDGHRRSCRRTSKTCSRGVWRSNGRTARRGGRRRKAKPLDARTIYLGFILAVDSAHHALRGIARSPLPLPDRITAAEQAVHDSLLYARREELLVLGATPVVVAGEQVFLWLIAVRDAVRAGARLEAAAYHGPYHKLAEARWALRLAVRAELGRPPFTPQALHRADWSDYECCAGCVPPEL